MKVLTDRTIGAVEAMNQFARSLLTPDERVLLAKQQARERRAERWDRVHQTVRSSCVTVMYLGTTITACLLYGVALWHAWESLSWWK